MGLSKEYRQFIADAFSEFAEVTVRPMFGGAGVYNEGTMFGLVTSDEGVYLKADDETKTAYEAEGLGPLVYQPPKGDHPPTAMPYWQIPDRLLEDPEEMAEWSRIAFEVALRTQKPKKPKKNKNKA